MEPKFEPLEVDLDIDPKLLIRAEKGDSFAQLDVGKAYFSTSNLNGNCKLAFHWFTRSAEQGNMDAQFRLGDMYALGDGVEKSEFTAYGWYLKSAIQGYPKALTRLHNLYHTEKSMYCRGQRDSKEAEWASADFKKKNNIRELNEYRVQQLESKLTKTQEYFTQLLMTCREQINDDEVEDKEDAYLKLGFLYQHGYGIRKIKNRAIEFYTLAAEKGNADAAYNLGHIFHHSLKMKWNYREAFKWYTIATGSEHIYASNGLALLYLKGFGTDIDYSMAISLYTKAAEGRNVNAMISLARIFRQGEIIQQDYEKSAEWYKKATMEDSTVAQNSLELLIANNRLSIAEINSHLTNKTPKVYSKKGLISRLRFDISRLPFDISIPDEDTRLEKLKKVALNAMKGDGYAMLDIGMKYYNGDDFDQDNDIAFKWVRKAAKSGTTTIQCAIAKLYKDGDSVEQDYHKASIWYDKSAKKGDVEARYNLGSLYHHGLGVRKDPLEASRWYTFAANRNNSDAQCQLGILRENGEGLRQDLPDALKWFNISARQNNPQAIYRLARIYENENEFNLALDLYKAAAKRGSVDAQLRLAKIHDKEESQYHDQRTVFKYYEMAANGGSLEAKYKLAIMYLDGKGVGENLTQAYYLFKETSELGYDNSANIFNIPINYSKTHDINYEKIADMFESVCEDEIDSLEYNLGKHYSNNNTFSYDNSSHTTRARNYHKEKWYKSAAEKNVPEAYYELAVINEQRNDVSKAVNYYNSAYRLSNADTTYKLACMYLDGYGVSQDLKKAFALFNEAYENGHKQAYRVLNAFEDDHQSIKLSLIKEMFQVSAISGNIISQYKLGLLMLEKESTRPSVQEAIKWLDMASRGGFIEASYRLGLLSEENNGIENPYQEIIRLYQIAADKGHQEALFRLAQIYHFGKKVERNNSKAYEFYALAAQQDHQPAQLAISITTKSIWESKRSHLNGCFKNLILNYASCFYMWEHIAEDGDSDLQYKLGCVYENSGGDLDMIHAAKWYFKASCDFHDDALYRLGRLYEMGLGANQNYTKAIEFYKRASTLNNNHALYQLGVVYQHGTGVEPDAERALFYYSRAAEKGNDIAQFVLGNLYENGTLLSQNLLEALKWYSVSALQGNKNAENWLASHYDELNDEHSFLRQTFRLFYRIVHHSYINYQQDRSNIGSALFKLGTMYYYGYGTSVNYKEAYEHYLTSSVIYNDTSAKEILAIKYENIDISMKDSYLKKLEMLEAVKEYLSFENIYELGSIYYHGVYSYSNDAESDETLVTAEPNEAQVIVEPDYSKSSEYFRIITEIDLPAGDYYMVCSYYLGMIYFVDIKHTNDGSKAHYYFTNALNYGSTDAQLFLRYINAKNADGLNEADIFEKVFEWHKEAQNTRHTKLIYNLGWMYDKGLGTQQDYKKAMDYYKIVVGENHTATEQGYLNRGGVKPNQKTSIEEYVKEKNENYVTASYRLGNMYFYGECVKKNYKIASQYYQVAAEKGHSDSQLQLGLLYTNGCGVIRNNKTAIELYIKAASQKNSKANYILGNIYFYGEGIEKDYKIAFQYYKAAAERGHKDSQLQLGVLYANGYGVEQNNRIAVEWYTKAATKKHSPSSLLFTN